MIDFTDLLDYFEPPVSIGFDVKPEAALEHFYAKGLRKSFTYGDLSASEHANSFTVAKMTDLDMLGDVKTSLEKALADGVPFKQWADSIMPTLQAKGWWGDQANPAWRLETIFRTNMQSAYAVGEWEQIRDQEEIAPFLMYDAVDDFRTRPEHAAMDGKIRPVNDVFWKHYHPPNGYNCRCSVIQLSQDDLDELGLTVSPAQPIKTYDWVNPKTGKVEKVAVGADPGFDFNPGEERYAEMQKLAREKASAMSADAAKAAHEGLIKTHLAAAQVAQVEAEAIRDAAKLSSASKAAERSAAFQIAQAIEKKTPYLSKAIELTKATKGAKDLTSTEFLSIAKEKAAKLEASTQLSEYKKAALAGKKPSAKAQAAFDAMPEEAQKALTEQIESQSAVVKAEKAAEAEILGLVENPNSLAAKSLAAMEIEGKSKVQILAELKADVAAKKAKQVSAQTLAGYKKAVTSGKVPTDAQKAAFEALPSTEKAKVLAEIDKAKVAALPEKPAGAGVPAPELLQENLVQIGPQKGSNPGGLYQDTSTGTQWYIKRFEDVELARNEVLAAKLYELAGVEVPDLRLTTMNGQPAIASRIIQGLSKGTPTELAKAADGFMADAWLANWDVAGASFDNLLLRNGIPVRVDTGGALRFRAQGGPKGNAFGAVVNEIDSLRNASTNPNTAKIFGKMTQAELEASAKRVLSLDEAKIRKLVEDFGPLDSVERKKLADLLIARQADIAKRFPNAAPVSAAARAEAVEIARFEALEALGTVNDSIVTAIKGIASRAAKGEAVLAKDIERVGESMVSLQRWVQDHGKLLTAQGLENIQNFYTPWFEQLKRAVELGPGKPVKWAGGQFTGFKGVLDIDPSRVKVEAKPAGLTFTQKAAEKVLQDAVGSGAKMTVPDNGGKQAFKNVPIEHQRAITIYTGSYYRSLNASLRAGLASPAVGQFGKLLNEALAISPKYQGEVTRGLSLHGAELTKYIEDHKKAMLDGSVIQHRGFISSTKGDSAAFGGNIVMHIESKNGVYVRPISLHAGENEVLLPDGARFTVQKVQQRGSTWHIHMKEI